MRSSIRSLVSGSAAWPLFLHGPAGTGKSCAALCLLDYAGGLYWTTPGLCDLLTRCQQGREEWYREGSGGKIHPEQFWVSVSKASLCVLDELGAREKVSDHHYECVKRVLDEREGRPLCVVSNLDPERLTVLYDDRIVSRLVAGAVVKVAGDDRRVRR